MSDKSCAPALETASQRKDGAFEQDTVIYTHIAPGASIESLPSAEELKTDESRVRKLYTGLRQLLGNDHKIVVASRQLMWDMQRLVDETRVKKLNAQGPRLGECRMCHNPSTLIMACPYNFIPWRCAWDLCEGCKART